MKSLLHLRAALLLASACGAAVPAFAAQNPDLKTTMTASATTVAAAGSLSFAVTVANVAAYRTVCTFDPSTRTKDCEPVVDSPAVTGVVVDITLSAAPTGTPTITGDSGFGTCVKLGTTAFRCQGATIQPEDAAHIAVQLAAPNAGGTFTVTASASAPGITDRVPGNNSASRSATVQPPVNTNLPDLMATVSGPSTFDGVKAVDFQVLIRNLGPVPAINATLEYNAISAASLGTPSFVGGGSPACSFFFTWNGLPAVRCTNISLAAFDTAVMNVRMAPGPFLPNGSVFGFLGTLDPGNLIQELSESNNLFSGIVTVVR